ncbi:MAG: hypothetical protein DWQ19_09290 [Crenarchaeota archaeon]|nr:MAG: hypothetical protein DWQ19_09290 [Thermoproteota archaeon]
MSNVVSIPLSKITTSHNPRNPALKLLAALSEEGYEGYNTIRLIQELALSDDPANKEKFVSLVETYENDGSPESLVSLAESRRHAEIQPILLRSFRVKAGTVAETGETAYVRHYGVVVGERRVLAAAYNHAKHGDPASIGAQVKDSMRLSEAHSLAVAENANRLPMNDLEWGFVIDEYRHQINPQTGKNWKLKEIAAHLGVDYQFARGRHALVYLPDRDKNRIACGGRVNITNAIRKALAIKMGKADDSEIPNKKANRQRVLTLRECQQLFDDTRNKQMDENEKKGFLRALATVMNTTYSVATKDSDKRLAEQSKQENRK